MSVSRREFMKWSAGGLAMAGVNANAKAADQVVIPKRKFGRHDEEVSVLGLGGHTLYLSGSQQDANEIVARAVDLGVSFFDNAWDYHGGQAEEYMGIALEGKRDKAFLMSKFCIFHNGGKHSQNKDGAMKMLEDSLRRLKTDHLDAWMLHHVKNDDGERAYEKNGAVEALELAKKQGKVRYTGFTGHTDPDIHIQLINDGFDWDCTLMPVSVVGALDSRAFEKKVMPLCKDKGIAVFGMKGFGGSRRTELHGKTNPAELLSYSLSYPEVCTHLIGVDKLDYVNQAVAATATAPMSIEQREQYVIDYSSESPDYYALRHGGPHYESGLSEKPTIG